MEARNTHKYSLQTAAQADQEEYVPPLHKRCLLGAQGLASLCIHSSSNLSSRSVPEPSPSSTGPYIHWAAGSPSTLC